MPFISPMAKRKASRTYSSRSRRRLTYSRGAARSVIRRAARRYLSKRRTRRKSKRTYTGRPKHVMYNRLLKHKILTTLTYCDTKTITPGTGAAHHWFRLNNLHDPDYTGGGHQPAFYDNWKLLFKNYRVLKASWSITMAPIRTSEFSLADHTDSSSAFVDTNRLDQARTPAIVFWEVGNNAAPQVSSAVNKNVLRETAKYLNRFQYKMTKPSPSSTYKLAGSTNIKSLMANPDAYDQSVEFGGNLAEETYLGVGAMSKDGYDAASYRFDIKLKFLVELTDPKSTIVEN